MSAPSRRGPFRVYPGFVMCLWLFVADAGAQQPWQVERVREVALCGGGWPSGSVNDLAFDSLNRPVICWTEGSCSGLRWARRNATSWAQYFVPSPSTGLLRLALRSDDHPFLIYTDRAFETIGAFMVDAESNPNLPGV